MRREYAGPVVAVVMLLAGCGAETTGGPATAGDTYHAEHAYTLLFGRSDNAEVVKFVAHTQRAVLVSSKSRKITLLGIEGGALTALRSAALFRDDLSESELTHIDVNATGVWATVTRTLIEKDSAGTTTACRGELVFVDVSDSAAFGTVLAQLPVGPMPDSVDIADDDRHVAVANERDKIWGKCEEVAGLEPPSVSIIEVGEGPAAAREIKRVVLTGNDEREPEYVAFSADNDLIAVTLQDSHEVGLLRISELEGIDKPTDAQVKIVRLPKNALGQDPWPDGVARFVDGGGRELFAAAGEANDTFHIFDAEGTLVHQLEISPNDIPAAYPRDGSWGPLFRPDSVASLVWHDKAYLGFTLKASGAVGIWDVSDASAPRLSALVKVGKDETAGADQPSTISPEGIAASSESGMIITANEGESSASLIQPK